MKNILRNSNFGFTKWFVALIAAGWMLGATGWGQTSTQNFGTSTGSLTSSSSTTTIPNPTSGTTYARIGTGSGSINIANTGNPLPAGPAKKHFSGGLRFCLNSTSR